MRDVARSQRKPLDFTYAFRSFMGYLEGTHKSTLTIKNYQSDLRTFRDFLESGSSKPRSALQRLSRTDLERFGAYLKARGFKSNTRRRKLMTVRVLLQYLKKRNRFPLDIGKQIPTPHKQERLPLVVPIAQLLSAIHELSAQDDFRRRTRLLFWTLAETGCLVSEVGRIRASDWDLRAGQPQLTLGKEPRTLAISAQLFTEASRLVSERARQSDWMFPGHNKFGPLGGPISARGVELLVRDHAAALGFPDLTPRTFRHSVVVHWLRTGVSQDEVKRRLGLKSDYAFRVYGVLAKSDSATLVSSAMSSPT